MIDLYRSVEEATFGDGPVRARVCTAAALFDQQFVFDNCFARHLDTKVRVSRGKLPNLVRCVVVCLLIGALALYHVGAVRL